MLHILSQHLGSSLGKRGVLGLVLMMQISKFPEFKWIVSISSLGETCGELKNSRLELQGLVIDVLIS